MPAKLSLSGSTLKSRQNISPDWQGSTRFERRFAQRLLEREGTGKAIVYFSQQQRQLSHYWYWYLLGTLWVSYSGWSDLRLWQQLFGSDRPQRSTSLMKPDEYALFQKLPEHVQAYRAHRPGEQDWLSYTVDPITAAKFAVQRDVAEVVAYSVPRANVIALFLRRGEKELLVLEHTGVERLQTIQVVKN